MVNFHHLEDVLNRFMLDGILGNYKEGELSLMQQNLPVVENMITPQGQYSFLIETIMQ